MRFLGFLFAVCLMSSNALAGFYIEPYVGYESGEVGDDKMTSTNFGGKLGMDMLGFAGGADVMLGSMSVTDDATDDSTTYNGQDLGVFAQFTFPILLKLSATYFVQSQAKHDETTISGSGTKVGIGYTGLPFVSINFDMINMNYDELKTDAGTFDVDSDRKSWMLSLSMPFSL